MSVNKFYRQAWIVKVYAEAVKLFHEARQCDENNDVPLADLARQSANTAFADNANTIIGDRETMARAFMSHCRDHFGTEIQSAIHQQARADIETAQQQEALAS